MRLFYWVHISLKFLYYSAQLNILYYVLTYHYACQILFLLIIIATPISVFQEQCISTLFFSVSLTSSTYLDLCIFCPKCQYHICLWIIKFSLLKFLFLITDIFGLVLIFLLFFCFDSLYYYFSHIILLFCPSDFQSSFNQNHLGNLNILIFRLHHEGFCLRSGVGPGCW